MILDIKTLAHSLTDALRENVAELKNKPHLTIVMVGDIPASEVYVRNKLKMCEQVGIKWSLLHLKESITEEDLLKTIKELNTSETHGILVQSPLPKHINAQKVFDTIDPLKDVDGFSSANISRLYCGDETGLIPGTPKGIMKIIENYFLIKNAWNNERLIGKHVVVIWKSTIVGKPLSLLLLNAGATVTICHSKTKSIAEYTNNADIVVSAVGKKNLVTADMIKKWSLVIDVGINVEEIDEKRILSGDCDTQDIAKIADITPVPGGVGPMTIAMLLSNVVTAYELQNAKE
jgi:methylenetetrahydrofolate dehydrogenase (NADP+) / methenyltetrahydrofolate cyclohydrolase